MRRVVVVAVRCLALHVHVEHAAGALALGDLVRIKRKHMRDPRHGLQALGRLVHDQIEGADQLVAETGLFRAVPVDLFERATDDGQHVHHRVGVAFPFGLVQELVAHVLGDALGRCGFHPALVSAHHRALDHAGPVHDRRISSSAKLERRRRQHRILDVRRVLPRRRLALAHLPRNLHRPLGAGFPFLARRDVDLVLADNLAPDVADLRVFNDVRRVLHAGHLLQPDHAPLQLEHLRIWRQHFAGERDDVAVIHHAHVGERVQAIELLHQSARPRTTTNGSATSGF